MVEQGVRSVAARRVSYRALLVLACAMFVALAAHAGPQDLLTGQAIDTKVGPRDVIDVKVFEDPNFNVRGTVGEDGRISMPQPLGKVDVSGMTATEIEQQIKRLLEARYLTKATVTVQVIEYGNKPISVVGAVTRPGSISTSGSLTLIQALTQAGGLASGYGKTLYVLRTGSNGLTEQIAIDIEDLLVNGNPDLNLPLAPNDVINVPVDTPITIYVLGEVMKPGPVQFRRSQTPTLLQALASAGGPTDRAGRNVFIKRTVNGEQTTISVNYRRITSGNSPDVSLQDNDTIFVKESIF